MSKFLLAIVPAAVAYLSVAYDTPMNAAEEEKAVVRAVLDYVEGVYECKPELIERSVHPELTKLGFYRRGPEEDYQSLPMTFDQLVELSKTYNLDGRIPEDAPKRVDVLDFMDRTATAKLTASWGIDYVHLAKYGDDWRIVHVLWQTRPER